MPSSSANNWVKPFLAGVLTTCVSFHLLQKKKSTRKSSSSSTNNKASNDDTNQASNEKTLMDDPKLDQRILRKAEAALLQRTSRLIIVVERCTNDHNYSAILRTAEALGVQHVYLIAPQTINKTLQSGGGDGDDDTAITSDGGDEGENVQLFRSSGQKVKRAKESEVQDRAQHHLFAQRALEWLQVTEFDTTKECIDRLNKDNYQIWSTDLSQVAVCLTKEALSEHNQQQNDNSTNNNDSENVIPEKLAIVFGTEAVGCTAEILSASHKRVYLPLRGFADSLNLSVATALIVHQLFILDPTLIGGMDDEERMELRKQWYAKLASQRLLSKGVKAKKRRMESTIRATEEIEFSVESGLLEKEGKILTREQKKKLEQLPILRKKLEDLNEELNKAAMEAVKDLVNNPPEPLGDMRRADEHRITYVGKKTKKLHEIAWQDMPATNNPQTEEKSSAAFFRGKVTNPSASFTKKE